MDTNKYFFDSCMFIEYSKNNSQAIQLWKELCLKTFDCVSKYNLKIHDAFILSTCIIYKIPNLVSLDKHFISPCENENINLIN